MANQPLVADQATTTAMVMAFNECQAECKTIQGAIDAAAAQLAVHWQSDQAAPTYQQAIGQWQVGFNHVRQGLDMLNENMQTYAQTTTTTEDDNAMNATGWASGSWAH